MVERQDIDALLISALYGELTPAEETRLAAHLESHPADRTALADLTFARDAVRESRILQVQHEPPQSVSALLMQEAARRAPKAQEEQAGWFQRFMRSFMMHPAMAAAAMLVLVVGVATIVTNRKGDHFAESTAPASQPVTQSEPGMLAGSSAAAGSGWTGNTDPAAPVGAVDQFQATLAEGDLGKGGQAGDSLADGKADTAEASGEAEKAAERKQREVAKADRRDAPANKPSSSNGIELRKAQPMPKDLDAAKEVATPRQKVATASRGTRVSDDEAKLEQGTIGGAAPGGGASSGAAAPRAPSPEPAPAAPSAVATNTPPPPPKATARDERAGGEKTVDRSRTAPPADSKPADPQLAWAREQHAAAVAQANAGKCQTAASLAVTIENRAPAYYTQNVSTDRALKNCSSYIIAEREKEAERRAERARSQKRANEPSRRAVDQPSKATTSKPTATDSK